MKKLFLILVLVVLYPACSQDTEIVPTGEPRGDLAGSHNNRY